MATATYEQQGTPSTLARPVWSALALDWEKAAYLTLIVLAFLTRFYDLGARVMSHDESLHTQYSWYLYANGNYAHDPVMHGPLKFHLTAFAYWLFGDNDFTARIPSALMGVAAVGLCYFFRKWIGRAGALAAAVLMLISPYQLYYSRYIRDEPYVMVWGLLLALMILNYMDTRAPKFLYGLAAVSALFYATMETSFIYTAIFMVFLGLHFILDLYSRPWPAGSDSTRRTFTTVLGIGLAAAIIGVAIFLYKDRLGTSGTFFAPSAAQPDQAAQRSSPLTVWADIAWLAALICGVASLWLVMRAFGPNVRRFASLDLIMVMGVFALPQLAAFPVKMMGFNPINYALPPMQPFDFFALINSDAFVTGAMTVFLIAASVLVGYIWNWRTFLICAAIFWAIYIPFYTTFFTNGNGLATGLVGSLGYWLEQHGVRRGSQPWYYYGLINLPIYEFLPTIGALVAAALGVRAWLRRRPAGDASRNGAAPADAAPPAPFPAVLFLGWWSFMAFAGFSIAGEKMPWLTTHIVLPMILLTGWVIGKLIEQMDWGRFRAQRAWLVALLLPLTIVAAASVFGALLGDNPPFRGAQLHQLSATTGFLSALTIAGLGVFGLYRLGEPLGWANVARLAALLFFGLLGLLTVRTAFIAAYVNYDYANEFLVYAHGSRGVKTVLEQVEDISLRTQDGLGLKVAYDDDIAWPMTWYFRNFYNQAYFADQPTREKLDAPVVVAGDKNWTRVEALLRDNYYKFEYIRMVWPMQDYFPESIGPRILSRLGEPEMRQALWNIWWNRDYTLYGRLTNQSFDLSKWPLADRMRLYVRKDIAAQIWTYGVGPTVLEPVTARDPYAAARQVLSATLIFGGQGQADGQFERQRGVAIAPDGSVYVADTFNHRIQKFDANGRHLLTFGRFGRFEDGSGLQGGTLNEPWGVGVGPDGSVYVADTWNNRIQKFDANGRFLTMWGKGVPSQDGAFDSFYGPRAVAISLDGRRVYVADTGNKRIVIFDENGRGIGVIGAGGFEPGFLDEPVGLAVDAERNVYVADTWNQRIQRFRPLFPEADDYVFDAEFAVEAWAGQSVENKPYLALDARGRIYVTEPEGYRVLVFDRDGQFLTTWGDAGTDNTTFSLLSGIAIGPEGDVYVSDSGNFRIMKFPPLP